MQKTFVGTCLFHFAGTCRKTDFFQVLNNRALLLLGVVYLAILMASEVMAFEESMPLRIHADWLHKKMDDASVVIVDARPNKEYIKEHVAGSVNIPVERTYKAPPDNHKVAAISRIQRVFSEAGISNESWVVIYDNGEYLDAARIFWVLEVYGHKNVGILDGGIEQWRQSGLPTSTGGETPQRTQFLPTVIPERLSTKLSTRLAIQSDNKVLIDSRSPEEYAGVKSKTDRFGHIPSAINIPSKMNYETNGKMSKLKTNDKLQSLYSELDKSKKVIAYCNRGRESALTYFILRELGFEVSTYDGSWMEWSKDETLPVNKP